MKEYNFISRETGINCTVIELLRNGFYEYYILTEFSADLYFCFGVHDQFTEHQLYTLFKRGYFDYIIQRAKMEDC